MAESEKAAAKRKVRQKAWYQKNRDKILARQKSYDAAHKREHRAAVRKHYRKNRKARLETMAKYRFENPQATNPGKYEQVNTDQRLLERARAEVPMSVDVEAARKALGY